MKEHYHFIGIGGAGMGPLALLMVAKGYQMSGSDLKENALTSQLRERGAHIFIGHEASHVHGADFVVYSSAIGEDNPERLEAKRRQIPILKRAELLAQLMNQQIGVAVAGAHGKTTTTSMISNLFIKAGLNPTTAVGGIVNGAYGSSLGDGRYFVAEMDESDGSFWYFYPRYAVITNIDFEHVDFYHNLDNIVKGYGRFIQQISDDGKLFIYGEDKYLSSLAKAGGKPFMTYGFKEDNDIYAKEIVITEKGSSFDCFVHHKKIGRIELEVLGEHNILNAMACVGVGYSLGVNFDIIYQSLKDFRGVQRRFQIKGDINNILIIDDYGHHPTEIRATIATARLLKPKRLVTVFQPHRYTRTKFLMEEFVDCLSLTDYLVLTDIYAASEKAIEGISSTHLWTKIQKAHKTAGVYLKKEDILSHLVKIVAPGDLVLFLGAGDINLLADQLIQKLSDPQTSNRVTSKKI